MMPKSITSIITSPLLICRLPASSQASFSGIHMMHFRVSTLPLLVVKGIRKSSASPPPSQMSIIIVLRFHFLKILSVSTFYPTPASASGGLSLESGNCGVWLYQVLEDSLRTKIQKVRLFSFKPSWRLSPCNSCKGNLKKITKWQSHKPASKRTNIRKLWTVEVLC